MHLLYRCLLFVGIFLLAHPLRAQDPHFSQYYASPWTLNPALTGIFNGKWRVVANYRDQWSSFLSPVPFRTYSAAFDMRMHVGRNDFATFGIGALHDEAGTARYMQNKALLGGAFVKQLSGGRYRASHYLSVGAQVGIGQNGIDWSKLWFSRQYNTGINAPDPNLSNGETNANANTNAYIDFNAGLLWYVLLDNDGFFYVGGAMHHLNSPAISLVNNDSETLYSRWSGQFGAQFPLSDNFSLMPSALIMAQGPSLQTNIGANIRYSNNDLNEVGLRFGAFVRMGNKLDQGLQMDAIIPVAMLEFNRWTLGLSYDLTVSSLVAANNSRGAFEISLSYFHPGERRQRIQCPQL